MSAQCLPLTHQAYLKSEHVTGLVISGAASEGLRMVLKHLPACVELLRDALLFNEPSQQFPKLTR